LHSPLNTNHINAYNDNIILHTQVKDSNNKEQNLMVLPDAGNRAKCILRYDIYQKLFQNQLLRLVNDVITIAKTTRLNQNSRNPREENQFFPRRQMIQVQYTTPSGQESNIALSLQSAFDLQRM
jgi:hypothetical protein